MKLTVVRHTSVDLPPGMCYGITEVALAPGFPDESKAIAEVLIDHNFDIVITSPRNRCQQLANQLSKGREIVVDPRLSEINFGEWEMTPWNDLFGQEDVKHWFKDYINVRTPGGESMNDLLERIKAIIGELLKSNYQHLLIVTHSGVLRAMIHIIEGKTLEEVFNISIKFGQIVEFEI